MQFKNSFEKDIFEIAKDVFGKQNIQIEHNKVILIEDTTSPATASFSGPPKKEIDVLSINLANNLNLQLLVSCKYFTSSKAEPAHIQEWCSVLNTMNKHSLNSKYIGIVISSSGFSSGCEAWASSYNIGLIPPLKGNNFSFEQKHVIAMFKRFCTAILKRLQFPIDDLLQEPNLFDFCYSITSDFEGFIEADTSLRYKISKSGWHSNFSELVSNIIGKKVESINCYESFLTLKLEDAFYLKYSFDGVQFGIFDNELQDSKNIPICTKNIENEEITFDKAKDLILGKEISSVADFQTYIELGINGELNLALIPPNRIHLMIFNEISKSQDDDT